MKKTEKRRKKWRRRGVEQLELLYILRQVVLVLKVHYDRNIVYGSPGFANC